MKKYFDIIMESGQTVIAGHTNPDGDCIGACFAVAAALSKLGKNAAVLMDSPPQRFSVIPINEYLYNSDTDNLEPDVFIALDSGDKQRLGRFASVFDRARVTFCVDHHQSNKGFADYNLIKPAASSTCEIVYDLIIKHISLDERIAAALYVGIVDDTGGFCHNCTSAKVHKIAARLLNENIPFSTLYNEVKNLRSSGECFGLKTAIENMVILKERGIAYSAVTLADMEQAGIKYTDFEGIAEFLVNIRGINLAFFAYEKPEGCRISLRSKDADVSLCAARLGGGGHHYAAGATVKKPVYIAADMVLREIEELYCYTDER